MSKFKDLFLIVEGGHFSDREIKKENKKKVRGKDMTKFFVKKPYFVLVTVIIVLVIGFVSFGEMQTDLLPKMELPYMAVITTEVGASPEKVESDVVKPMESTLGTINGVEKLTSTSANNYGMLMLEFAEDTNMEAALVRVSKALNSLDLPEGCGTPNIMEISADMMATMYASVSYEGKDIKELSSFTEQTVKPYLERQDGVASVSANGLIQDHVEIRLNEKKIDRMNDKILGQTNDKLLEASDKIEEAKASLKKSKEQLKKQEKTLSSKQEETNTKLAEAQTKLAEALSQKAAYEAELNSLKASQSALKAEKKAYKDAGLEKTYKTLNNTFKSLNATMGEAAKQMGITIPSSVKEAIQHPKQFEAFVSWMEQMGYGEQFSKLTIDSLKQMYKAVEVRLPQIDTELSNLQVKIKVQKAIIDKLNEQMKGLDEQQSKLIAGGYSAAAGFGSGQAQIAAGKTQIESAEKELKEFVEETGNKLAMEYETEVVITGIDFPVKAGVQEIGNLICQDGNTTWVTAAKEGGSYSGTGDLFASVLSAGMVKGIDTVDSVHRAVKFLAKGIHDAVVEGTDRNEGICFERYLSELAAEN